MRVVPLLAWVQETRPSFRWPSFKDFQENKVWVLPKDHNAIFYGIQQAKHVLIIGDQGRGKSTLALVAGFSYYNSKLGPVDVIDCRTEGQRVEQVLGFLRSNEQTGKTKLWIIEDMQYELPQMSSLYARLEKFKHSRFIFLWRRSQIGPEIDAVDWLNHLRQNAVIVPVLPQLELIYHVIREFLISHAATDLMPSDEADRHRLCERMLARTGGNIRRLINYLDLAKQSTRPLEVLTRSDILQHVWHDTLKPLDAEGDLHTYVQLAAVAQLDARVQARGIQDSAALMRLEDKGLVVQGPAGYYSLDPPDAEDAIIAFAKFNSADYHTITNQFLFEYLDQLKRHTELQGNRDKTFASHLSHLMRVLNELEISCDENLSHVFKELVITSDGDFAKTQYIKTFLHNRRALRQFLSELQEIEFAEMLVQAPPGRVKHFLDTVRELDPNSAEAFKFKLIDCYAKSSSKILGEALSYFSHSMRGFVKLVVASLEQHVDDIIWDSMAGSGKLIGVVIDFFPELARELAAKACDKISLDGNYNSGQLSKLLNNLAINKSAQYVMVERVIQKFTNDVEAF